MYLVKHVVLPRLVLSADFIVLQESCARSQVSTSTYSSQRTYFVFFYPKFSDLLSVVTTGRVTFLFILLLQDGHILFPFLFPRSLAPKLPQLRPCLCPCYEHRHTMKNRGSFTIENLRKPKIVLVRTNIHVLSHGFPPFPLTRQTFPQSITVGLEVFRSPVALQRCGYVLVYPLDQRYQAKRMTL